MNIVELFFGKIPKELKEKRRLEKLEEEKLKQEKEKEIKLAELEKQYEEINKQVKSFVGKLLYLKTEKLIEDRIVIFKKVSLRKDNMQITFDIIPAKFIDGELCQIINVNNLYNPIQYIIDARANYLKLESALKLFGFVPPKTKENEQ